MRRLPFAALTRLEAESSQAVVLATTHVTRMKANCEDAPYCTDKVRAPMSYVQLYRSHTCDISVCMPFYIHEFVVGQLCGMYITNIAV